MKMQGRNLSAETKPNTSAHRERPHFSRAIMEVAKNNLREFESQSDEAFLVRAEMERKLSSL